MKISNRDVYFEMPKTVIPCPVCRGTTFRTLASIDRYQMGVETVGCLRCGLVMTNPMPTPEALIKFYREEYRRFYRNVDVPNTQHIQSYHLDVRSAYTVDYLVMQAAVFNEAKVVDVGCGEGSLLREIKTRFPKASVTGVEPSRGFSEFARKHAGCTVYKNIDELFAENHPLYDLIIVNHVLEHVTNPVSLLENLARLLVPHGRLYVDVPNLAEYRSVDALHLAHVYHFSPRTLATVGRAAGLSVETIEAHSPPMHPKSVRCLFRYTSSRFLNDEWDERAYIDEWAIVQRLKAGSWMYFLKRSKMIRKFIGYPVRVVRTVLARRN